LADVEADHHLLPRGLQFPARRHCAPKAAATANGVVVGFQAVEADKEDVDWRSCEIIEHLGGIDAVGVEANADAALPACFDHGAKAAMDGRLTPRDPHRAHAPGTHLVEQ